MRPKSYREHSSPRRCGTCCHARYIHVKDDLLCFAGDAVEDAAGDAILDGQLVGLLDGDAYDRAWAGRTTEEDDTCDEWSPDVAAAIEAGPDDWRTPPGAPTIARCPVEEMPEPLPHGSRLWVVMYGKGIESRCIYSADGLLRLHIPNYGEFDFPDDGNLVEILVAWRPPAVGPGEVEG